MLANPEAAGQGSHHFGSYIQKGQMERHVIHYVNTGCLGIQVTWGTTSLVAGIWQECCRIRIPYLGSVILPFCRHYENAVSHGQGG